MDLQSFSADLDRAVLLNADLDPAAFIMRIWNRILNINCNNISYQKFSGVENVKKIAQKLKNMDLIQNSFLVLPISLHFSPRFFHLDPDPTDLGQPLSESS